METPETRETGRVSRKYAERQARIIGVATRIINRRGVSGMTLAQVAAEMDMTPANIAYYFKTKEERGPCARRSCLFFLACAPHTAPR